MSKLRTLTELTGLNAQGSVPGAYQRPPGPAIGLLSSGGSHVDCGSLWRSRNSRRYCGSPFRDSYAYDNGYDCDNGQPIAPPYIWFIWTTSVDRRLAPTAFLSA